MTKRGRPAAKAASQVIAAVIGSGPVILRIRANSSTIAETRYFGRIISSSFKLDGIKTRAEMIQRLPGIPHQRPVSGNVRRANTPRQAFPQVLQGQTRSDVADGPAAISAPAI